MTDFTSTIRLPSEILAHIITCFRAHFGAEDHVWVFGSRVNMHKKGGDIDLYIETHAPIEEATTMRLAFVTALWQAIGPQKIDVVVRCLSSTYHLSIYDIARQEGVQLT